MLYEVPAHTEIEMVRTKICGLTSIEELHLAERAGVDAIGVLVGQTYAASDFVPVGVARKICQAALPFTTTVLVTHIDDVAAVEQLVREVGSTVVQLHSDMDPARLAELRARLWPKRIVGKVSVEDARSEERARLVADQVDAVVLDTIDRATGRVGGTGITHDWRISARIRSNSRAPVILAGGLTPFNVAAAIEIVRPWAVDVNSGVEDSDGAKSSQLIHDFVEAARRASSA